MNKISNLNHIDILKHIIRHNKVTRDRCTIIITGRVGPTGKTWLCNELCKKGYRAMELSPLFHSIVINDDGVNHVIVDEGIEQVIVVLNEILPMYWGRFGKTSDFEPEGIYMFKTRSQADNVLYEMKRIADVYGVATRLDFKDLINQMSCEEDRKYGWCLNTIRKARVVSHALGYFIEFPRAANVM